MNTLTNIIEYIGGFILLLVVLLIGMGIPVVFISPEIGKVMLTFGMYLTIFGLFPTGVYGIFYLIYYVWGKEVITNILIGIFVLTFTYLMMYFKISFVIF